MRANAVKFSEDVYPAIASSSSSDPEYEVIFDNDADSDEETRAGTKMRPREATTTLKPSDEATKPSDKAITKKPSTETEDDEVNPLPSPEATPIPETIRKTIQKEVRFDDRIVELPDDYEKEKEDDPDDNDEQEENIDDELQSERPIPPVSDTALAAQESRRTRGNTKPSGFYDKLNKAKIDKYGRRLVDGQSLLIQYPLDIRTAPSNEAVDNPSRGDCVTLLQAVTMARRSSQQVPKSFRQARKMDDYYGKRLPAMERQMEQLKGPHAWDLVDPPEGAKGLTW